MSRPPPPPLSPTLVPRVASIIDDPPLWTVTSPPLVSLPDCDHTGSLPVYWRRALPSHLRSLVKRLPVPGDGTCADAAIIQAVESSESLDRLPLSQLMSAPAPVRATATFRQHEVGSAIAEWTVDDWASKVPEVLRDGEWDERCRTHTVAQQPARTLKGEFDFFRDVLSLPTHAVGLAYMHAAAGALQHGILLLTADHRFRTAGVSYHLDDFGTEEYDSSIIIFLSVTPPQPEVRRRGDGHYETVCLHSPDDGDTHTIFERRHPLLCSLRAWAVRNSDDRALDHERLHYSRFAAISMRPGEAFRGTVAIPTGAAEETPPVVGGSEPGQSGTRPRRNRVRPARLRDDSPLPDVEQRAPRGSAPARPPAARFLRSAFDASATGHPAATGSPASDRGTPPRRARSQASLRSDPAAALQPAAAASRAPSSGRAAALGGLAKRNLRAWVRARSGRGRLASRVHISTVPLWTARCRTVLLGLASALQERPMNEPKVITWLCVLWMLPQEVFTVPGRARGGKAGRKSRYHRIHHAGHTRPARGHRAG